MKLVDLAGVLLEGVALEKVATPMELTLTLVVGDEKLELEWRVDELLLETFSVLMEAEVVNRSDSRLKSSTDSVLPLEAESFPVSTPEFPLALLPP